MYPRGSALLAFAIYACGGTTKTTTGAPPPVASASPSTSTAQAVNPVDAGVPFIDPNAVRQVIRASFGHFKLCYVTALKKKKGLSGRVETQFVIDETGHVISAEDVTKSNVLQDDDARACIVSKFKMLEFPPPQPSGKFPVTYPLLFEPGIADDSDAGTDTPDDYAHTRPPFNPAAAMKALSAVDVKPCSPAGFHGTGHIKITFDPSGVVTKTDVDAPAAIPAGARTCVAKAFAAARTPVFEGSAVTVGKNFTVP